MKEKIRYEKLTHCPVCDSPDFSELYQVTSDYIPQDLPNKFDLVKCTNCGFTFINPRPDKGSLGFYYPSEYPYYHFKKETSAVKDIPKNGKKFLDIGFGSGNLLIKKHMEGYECYGLDTSEFAIQNLNERNLGINLKLGTLLDSSYSDNFFDEINMCHVIEHLPDPLASLHEVFRILKPEGILKINVPNYAGLYYSLFARTADYFVPQHLSFFTPDTMAALLEKSKFDDFSITTEFGNNTSYHILHTAGIQDDFYKPTIFNKILGLFVLPLGYLLNKKDVIKVVAIKS